MQKVLSSKYLDFHCCLCCNYCYVFYAFLSEKQWLMKELENKKSDKGSSEANNSNERCSMEISDVFRLPRETSFIKSLKAFFDVSLC